MAPDHGASSTKITFVLRNTSTGEETSYQGVFLGPAGAPHKGEKDHDEHSR
jgi:hypothetical protein